MNAQPDIPKSCATLTAQLVVEGCLPMIKGDIKGAAPTTATRLTEEERHRLGLKPEGLTVFYPAGEEGVFMDLYATEIALWFIGDDYQNATNALHTALLRAFPKTTQLDDVTHSKDKRLHARTYRVELQPRRFAAIQTSFRETKSGAQQFTVQIKAEHQPG